MINTNTLVANALQRVGCIGDEQADIQSYSVPALNDLKAVITDLNTQNYILENYQTIDWYGSKELKIGKLPKGWYEYETVEQADNDLVNRVPEEVCKIGKDTFRFCTYVGQNKVWSTNDQFNKDIADIWPDVIVKGNTPDRLIGCARKLNNRFIKLYPADKMKIDSFGPTGKASMYCCETEYGKIKVGLTEYFTEVLHIEFNTYFTDNYRFTYLEAIDDLDLKTPLYYSTKYQNLIEDGLCVKLCMRYGFLDKLPIFSDEYEIDKRNIKVINDANRPEVFENFAMQGYNAPFEKGLAGDGW